VAKSGRSGKRADIRPSESDRVGGGGKKPKRGKKRSGGGLGSFLRRATYWSLILGIWCTVAIGGVIAYYGAKLPAMTNWEVPDRPPNVKVLASNGELIANRGDTGGEPIKISTLPPYVKEAVIAIEDRRFYSHFGVDPIGILRAVFTNLSGGRVSQGGSTLTQQLAKNLFLKPDRTFERKVQEVILSLWLEARYSKDEILELYLNRVYLGAGVYGIDAAAHRYFGKPAQKLNLAEAAVIAGLLKAPSRYSPATDVSAAKARSLVVLAAMQDAGFISEDQKDTAAFVKIDPVKPPAAGSGGYAADWVADLVPGFVGKVKGDLVVETTIDMRLQSEAAKALEDGLAKDGKTLRVSQGALVSMDADGAVRALIGGRNYETSQFDRAVDAKRQPGSSFKPFAYLAALERGYTPETVRIDQPVAFGNWRPQNYGGTYHGPVTLTTALSHSLNTVAAQIGMEVGPKAVVEVAHRLGVKSELQAVPSIVLGTSEVSVLEMAGAYAPFANGGYGVLPYVIKRIKNADGKVLYERKGNGPGAVISATYVGMMNAMLRETVRQGTATRAAIKGWDVAGKTGTSQDYRDAWFIGYTATMVTAVWLGNDDSSPMRSNTGGGLPAQIWQKYMTAALSGWQPTDLPGNYRRQDDYGPDVAARGPTSVDDVIYGDNPNAGYAAPYDPRRPGYVPPQQAGYPQGYPPPARGTYAGGPVPPGEVGAPNRGGYYPPRQRDSGPGGFFRRLFGG
jgi:penicillin-binding protein 1A